MTIEEYEPKSTLVVPGHPVQRAKYPFIDVHNHQDTDLSAESVAKIVAEMGNTRGDSGFSGSLPSPGSHGANGKLRNWPVKDTATKKLLKTPA